MINRMDSTEHTRGPKWSRTRPSSRGLKKLKNDAAVNMIWESRRRGMGWRLHGRKQEESE
jgi:hypothetical protein